MACVLVNTFALVFPSGVESPQSAGEGDVLWRAPVRPVFCQCSGRPPPGIPELHLVNITYLLTYLFTFSYGHFSFQS